MKLGVDLFYFRSCSGCYKDLEAKGLGDLGTQALLKNLSGRIEDYPDAESLPHTLMMY